MQYRRLGNSDLHLSAVSLGSWLTFGTNVDDSAARRSIRAALDSGVNFFDTANMYGQGAAETFLGKALRGRRRDSYILGTKLFFSTAEGESGLSAEQVRKQAIASLRRLGTGHIDLYQCHRFDPNVPLEETMGALTALIDEGLVRHVGFSEWTAKQIAAAARVPNVTPFVSSQPEYSMLKRNIEADVVPISERHGVGQIVFGALAQGVLSGKYLPGQAPPPGSRSATEGLPSAMIKPWMSRPELLRAVQRLKPIADEVNMTMPQLALAWVLSHRWVTSAIVGASTPEQVTENAAAADMTLPQDLIDAVDKTVADVQVTQSLDQRLSSPERTTARP